MTESATVTVTDTAIGTLFPDFPEVHPNGKQVTRKALRELPAKLRSKPENIGNGPSKPKSNPENIRNSSSKLKFNPENVRNGLAKLVLTLVEMIRELLERQAIRRIDAGSVTEEETERMGETFARLAEEIERLKNYFGFTDEDLNLDLGPLGKVR